MACAAHSAPGWSSILVYRTGGCPHPEAFIGQDDPRPGACSGQGRHQPGRPGSDDQQVAEGLGLVIGVRIGLPRRPAQPGGPPDQRFVYLLPERRRPHEGLVVEARPEQRRREAVDRQRVEIQRRPTVLAGGNQTVVQFDRRGAGIRLSPCAGAQLDQGIGFVGACRQDAARPVVFEGAADQPDIIGEQRRSERVAGKAGVAPAVELELKGAGAIARPPVAGQPTRLRRRGALASVRLS